MLALAAPGAPAQGPDYDCLGLTMLPMQGGGGSGTKLHELAQRLPEALEACEEGARIRPREGRMHASLARVRALAGDTAGALEAARRGVELDSHEARVLLGALQARSDPAGAIALFRAAVRDRQKLASYNLGAMAANGLGLARDPQDAANFFRDAARAGDMTAMVVIGQLHAQGAGVPADRRLAEEWWRKAAESMMPEGVPDPARLVLAEPVLDTPALLAWYAARAQAGETWAQAWLAMLYDSGQWVARDPAAAAFWYARAGQAGHGPSQIRLANMYRLGLGVPKDLAESRRWGEMPQIAFCERRMAEAAGANDCDRLAGDPYQPDKIVPGVFGDCLARQAEAAIAACRRAVAELPAEVRFRAQYARALAHANRFEDAAREARKAADRGSTPAMVLLGAMHQRGLGTARDGGAAMRWYRKAAEAGDPRGSQLILYSVQHGIGIDAASPDAAALATLARERLAQRGQVATDPVPAQAERGDARSQFALGLRLEARKDHAGAMAWYRRAAAQGYAGAAMQLAQMYENGIGVPADPAEAMARYTALADEGHAEARYRLALLQAKAGNDAEAVKRLRKGVEHDDQRAMLDLGENYEQGRGVPRDPARAAALYEKAADRSNWARARLGAMALTGTGMARDAAKARRWLEQAASGGDHSARNNLGVMAEGGIGMPVDVQAARDHYLAALYGAPQARGNLENLYAKDLGTPADPAAAAEWYRPAATAGIAAAQWRLGLAYLQGRGVPRDEQEAARWLAAAAEQGHPGARADAGRAFYALAQKHARGADGKKDEAAELRALLGAAVHGHPAALAAIGARAPDLLPYVTRRPPPVATPPLPTGVAHQPDEDTRRRMQVRIAGLGSIQSVASDAGIGNPWLVIPWTPIDQKNREADAKKRAPGER